MLKLPAWPYVSGGLGEGLSANQAFRNYQTAAREESQRTGEPVTAGRRTVFLQMYSATRTARANVVEAMNAPRDLPGGGVPVEDRPTVRAKGYVNYAVTQVRAVGSSDVMQQFYWLGSDEPLTPAEVEAKALRDFQASAADIHGSQFGFVIEGVAFTGTQRLIPTEGA